MNSLLELLQSRNSAPRLVGPGPDAREKEQMFRSALRAPDHAWLRPWRFLCVEGDRRGDLGAMLERRLLRIDPQAPEAARTKALQAPYRAPLVVIVAAHIVDHPKVPSVEQRLSTGCAAHAILLAAEALGYAGIWRTGAAAFDREFMTELGLEENEEVLAFLYIGTRDGRPKALPQLDPLDFVRQW